MLGHCWQKGEREPEKIAMFRSAQEVEGVYLEEVHFGYRVSRRE